MFILMSGNNFFSKTFFLFFQFLSLGILSIFNFFFSYANLFIYRTVEEFRKGHVDSDKIINIAYMFNTPEGNLFYLLKLYFYN